MADGASEQDGGARRHAKETSQETGLQQAQELRDTAQQRAEEVRS